jgi:methionine-rich copper-binding protein CopC
MLSTFLTPRRHRLRGAAVLLAAAAALAASAAPALAHDELVSTNPTAGATVARPPTEVVLTFGETVLPLGTQVVVTGPDGPVSDGSPSVSGKEVRQPLRSGPAGTYDVAWRATSEDGHPVSGTFAFTAQAASPPTTSSTSPTAAPPTSSGTTVPTPAATSTTPATTPAPTSVTTAPTAGASSTSPWVWALVVLAVVAIGLGGWVLYRRRASADPGSS